MTKKQREKNLRRALKKMVDARKIITETLGQGSHVESFMGLGFLFLELGDEDAAARCFRVQQGNPAWAQIGERSIEHIGDAIRFTLGHPGRVEPLFQSIRRILDVLRDETHPSKRDVFDMNYGVNAYTKLHRVWRENKWLDELPVTTK